jgi:hypothetical protein
MRSLPFPIEALYGLPKPTSEEQFKRIEDLQDSLYFNLGYLELHVIKITGLDVFENEAKVMFDAIN